VEQQVTVIALEGNEAVVRGHRASACGGCAGKTSCSTMGSWVERVVELRVGNTIGAQIGDRVMLEVPDNAVLRIAFRLYGMPMLAFIVAGLGAQTLALYWHWPGVEVVAALSGFAAVLSYYLWYKWRVADHHQGLDVRMVRVIHDVGDAMVNVSPGHGKDSDALLLSSH